MYAVVVHRRAARYLGTLSQDQQGRVKQVLNEMKNDPLAISGIKPMVGDWAGYHRVRVGNVGVIFWIDKDKNFVSVDHIGPRGDVYKGEPDESIGTVRRKESILRCRELRLPTRCWRRS